MARKPDRIKDVGAKIGGSRKDQARERLNLDVLSDLNTEERIKLVKKNAVWPEPKWDDLVKEGMQAVVAAKIRIIRRNLAPQPTTNYKGAPPTFERASELYVEMVTSLADALVKCKTEQDLNLAVKKFREEHYAAGEGKTAPLPGRYGSGRSLNMTPDRFQIYKSSDPLPFNDKYGMVLFSSKEEVSIKKDLAAGFPLKKVEPFMKGLVIKNIRMVTNPKDKREDWIYADKVEAYYSLANSIRRVGYFDSKEAAIAAAKLRYEEKKKKRINLPERPHVDQVTRRGPNYRGGYNISAERLMKEFNFRAIEFGEWLPNDERQVVVNAAWCACHDLADALGISPEGVSLGGTLSLAFGARGKGHADAHFEPGRMVMNMTRMRGAGSLAHEWGHALDFYIANSRAPTNDLKMEGKGLRYASGGSEKYSTTRSAQLRFLPPNVVSEVNKVMTSLSRIQLTPEEDIARWEDDISKLRENRVKIESKYSEYLAAESEGKKTVYGMTPEDVKRHYDMRLADVDKKIERCQKAIMDIHNGGVTRTIQTSFADEACKIGKTDYWVKPTEMFARAFEAWVQDKLNGAQNPRISTYLVHGTDHAIFDSLVKLGVIAGNPYPGNRERKEIGKAFESFMRVIGPEYGLVNKSPRPLNAITIEDPKYKTAEEDFSPSAV